jgi:hypothetical protein
VFGESLVGRPGQDLDRRDLHGPGGGISGVGPLPHDLVQPVAESRWAPGVRDPAQYAVGMIDVGNGARGAKLPCFRRGHLTSTAQMDSEWYSFG